MNMKKLFVRIGIVAALVAGSMTTPMPSSATVEVWDCAVWSGGDPAYYAQARCNYGLGGVRVAGYCWNGSYDEGPYYGPWKSAGQISTMICGGGKLLDGAWYETW